MMLLSYLRPLLLSNAVFFSQPVDAFAYPNQDNTSNVSIKLFQSSGNVKIVTNAQFYADIRDLTNRSNAINQLARGITVLNGPLGVLGLGPYPQVIQGISDLITAAQSYLLTIYASPQVYDTATVTNISYAYQDFLVAHSALMQTLITRAGLFAVVPAIGNSLSQAINLDLVLVRGFWASLYNTYPAAKAPIASNQAVLEFYIQNAIWEYQGLLNSGQVDALSTAVFNPLTGEIGSALSSISSLASGLPSGVSSLLGSIGAGISSLAGGAGATANTLVSDVGAGAGSVVSNAGGVVGSILGGGAGTNGAGRSSTPVSLAASATDRATVGASASASISLSVSNSSLSVASTLRSSPALSNPAALSTPSPSASVDLASLLSSVSALSSGILTPTPVSRSVSSSSGTAGGPSVMVLTVVTVGTSTGPLGIGSSVYTSTATVTYTLASSSNARSTLPQYTTTVTSLYATITTVGAIAGIGGSASAVIRTTTFTSTVTPAPVKIRVRSAQAQVWTG